MRTRTLFMIASGVVRLAAAVGLIACGGDAGRDVLGETGAREMRSPEAGPRLWLEAREDRQLVVMTSEFAKVGPRVMELWIKTSNVASVERSDAGDALKRAGKKLIVQRKNDELLRLIAVSSENVSPIGAGEIATVHLQPLGAGPIGAEILTDRPMFAPREAQDGLVVGDPIEL